MRRLSSHSGVVFSLFLLLLILFFGAHSHQSVLAETLTYQGADDLCAVTPYDMDGQARYRFVDAGGASVIPSLYTDIATRNAILDSLPDSPPYSVSSDTVVIIIDNFTRYGGDSHGNHVRSVLEQALRGSQIFEINYADIGYTAREISYALGQLIDDERISPNQAVIVNMSFAFIPCFNDYFEYVGQYERDLVDYVGGRDNLQRLLEIPGEGDDFQLYLQSMRQNYPRFVAVAAAGNFGDMGYNRPFFPAQWPGVVSVSADGGYAYNPDIEFISNPGEVQLPGGWFEIEPGSGVWHIGSSFAAPLFSAWIAAQYANGVVCDPGIFDPVDPSDFGNWIPADWESLACGSAPPVNPNPTTLDMSLPALYESVSLRAGFGNDPYQISMDSGGPVDASSVQTGCVGFVSGSPSVELNWSGQTSNLRIFFSGQGDTTLVINDAAGNWVCDDDSGGNTNPLIDFPNAIAGVYDIWVGTYGNTGSISGELNITELNISP